MLVFIVSWILESICQEVNQMKIKPTKLRLLMLAIVSSCLLVLFGTMMSILFQLDNAMLIPMMIGYMSVTSLILTVDCWMTYFKRCIK